ncbi:t-cell surface antigen cd2-like isoform x1 [Limosa lapponica baueri]|uniref:T-cell surface antigen cd2-like isoform x1 n=1 Tax=Limosa lapponica baueri TaxID=1758121 RepID=A0A2I0U4Z3_LIMLA|nr:t-cell surface antigen cd2-like isoform x1 [Limosa lapponica baueri]
MDFSSPFTLQCLLVIITVTHGSVTSTSVLSGGSAVFSVGIQSLQNLSGMRKTNVKCFTAVLNDTLLAECGNSAGRCLNLQNGSLVLRSVEKEDEGKYEFVFHNTTRSFTLEVFEPAISVRCFPNGTGELSCDMTSNESTSFQWLLNGTALSAPEACVKDGGKKVRLDKTVPGEFVCEVYHGKSVTRTRPVVLSCSYGDLLQYPWFIYILAGCAGGAVILVVIVSSVICCCMKRKHKFMAVPSEEEKDDGLIMSVVSSEGVKSPPNGDHVEAQAAQIDCPPKPDAARTGQGVEPQPLVEENLPVEIEPEEMPDPEVIIDVENQENASDCFPDPVDD